MRINNNSPQPVFVGGLYYESLFWAGAGSGISETSLSIGIRRNNKEPCKIRKTFVVLESWVNNRIAVIKSEYAL
jgi:hypothetical protein